MCGVQRGVYADGYGQAAGLCPDCVSGDAGAAVVKIDLESLTHYQDQTIVTVFPVDK